MNHAVAPERLAGEFRSSTEGQREDLVRAVLQMSRKGTSRQGILDAAVGAGWSAEFAGWAHDCVIYHDALKLVAPTSPGNNDPDVDALLEGRRLYRIGVRCFVAAVIVYGAMWMAWAAGTDQSSLSEQSRDLFKIGAAVLYVPSVWFVGAGAWAARRQLKLTEIGILAGCVLSFFVPFLFLALLLSLPSRLDRGMSDLIERRGRDAELARAEEAETNGQPEVPQEAPSGVVASVRVRAVDASERIEGLERLSALWKAGALTDDEFASEKERILGRV